MPIIDYNRDGKPVHSCSPRRLKPMPKDRTCSTPGCDTKLSIYNQSTLCGPCSFDGSMRSQKGLM